MATISNRRDTASDALHLLQEVVEAPAIGWAQRCWQRFRAGSAGRVLALSRRIDLSDRARYLLEALAGNRVFRGPVAAGMLAEITEFLRKLDPDAQEPRQDDGEAAEGQDIDPATDDAS